MENNFNQPINTNESMMSTGANTLDKRVGRGWKFATIGLAGILLVGGGLMIYGLLKKDTEVKELKIETGSVQQELRDLKEIGANCERISDIRTETKSTEDGKCQVKETKVLVKTPLALEVKMGQLFEKLKQEHFNGQHEPMIKDSLGLFRPEGSNFRGDFYTNTDASYLFATLGVQFGPFNLPVEYYRALPDGDWKLAYYGQKLANCDQLSEETRKVYRTLEEAKRPLCFTAGSQGTKTERY